MTAHRDVILLVLDTQRVDRLSCYGYNLETTPYLDKIASDATLFHHAYSTAQWTVPSHTSMFTGLYASQHQMLHAFSVLSDNVTTLAERLSEQGYFAAAFCNNPLIGIVNTGLQRGFHSFLNYGGLMSSRPHQTGNTKRATDRYRQYFKRGLANILTSMQDVFARSDTLLNLSLSPLFTPLWQTALRFKGNTAKALQDTARLHIERRGLAQHQPIFSFVNLMGTHMPYHPPQRFVKRFAPHDALNRTARRYLRRFNSDVFGWMAPLTTEIDEQNKAILNGMYDAEVARQDEQVGAFIEQLRASGALDRTLLIICADHGEHFGEKQLMGHSISLYNPLVHVPLIIRDPDGDFPHHTTRDHVVSTRRIFHTILTATGLASASEQKLTLAHSAANDPEQEQIFALGVTPQNLLNLMQRKQPALIQAHRCDQPRRAAWQGRYKLIQTGDDSLELYDVFDDPEEQTNLRDILPEQVEKLQPYLQRSTDHDDTTDTMNDAETSTQIYDDPQVYHRLRDLGYLE